MSEAGQKPLPPRKSAVKWAALVIVVLLGIAAVYGALSQMAKPGASLKPLATGAMAKLAATDPPRPAPTAAFEGPDGRPITLAAYKGQVVAVNLWATWCAPCVKEMPTLARLQAAYAGKPVRIVPVSIDRGSDLAKAKAFIARHPPLKFHHAELDWTFKLDPPAQGFPTTIIFDRQGRERARLTGDAEWTSPEAHAVIERLLTEASAVER